MNVTNLKKTIKISSLSWQRKDTKNLQSMVTDTKSNGFWIMKKTGNGHPTRISIWSMLHMAIPITGCEGKRPFLVLWRGLICTVNIRMENIIIRFLQEMHMTFFLQISKGSSIFIRMPSQNPIYAHQHSTTGPVLLPDFSIICKIMAVVPWLMLQKKWYSRFLPRTAAVHGVMTTYKGSGQY